MSAMDDRDFHNEKKKISVQEYITKLRKGWRRSDLESEYELPYPGDFLEEKMKQAGISSAQMVLKARLGKKEILDNYLQKKGILDRRQLLSIASVLGLDEDQKKFFVETSCSPGTKTIVDLLKCGYDVEELSNRISIPSFEQVLTELMAEKGVNDTQLAEKTKIDRTTIYRYKKGGILRPSRDNVLKIARVLELSLEETQLLLKSIALRELKPGDERDAKIIKNLWEKTAPKDSNKSFDEKDNPDNIETGKSSASEQDPAAEDTENATSTVQKENSFEDKQDIGDFIKDLIQRKNTTFYDTAIMADMGEKELRSIRDGNRAKNRDGILRIAISQHLSFEETQHFLEIGNVAPLGRNSRRDIVIMDGIIKSKDIDGINDELRRNDLPLLKKEIS